MSRMCDEFDKALKGMLNELEVNGPVEESLSSFIGNCAGIPVSHKELILDVQNGLKSYESNMNDFCSLSSVLKRPKYTHTYIAPLDDDQLKGFKLFATQGVNDSKIEVAKVDGKTGKHVERKHKPRKKKENKHHIILTLKRTDTNSWKSKEEPQKIVPIYTEQISGKPTRRSFNSFK